MEKEIFIRQEAEKTEDKETESAHKEAMEFVEKHKDILEHETRGRVNIKPAPPGLPTFAFDFETDDLYANSRFYKDYLGLSFSDAKTLFATRHEIRHFLEKKNLLAEEGGERKFEKYLKKLEESRAYKLTDNCLADIRENRTVIKETNESQAEIERKIYKEDLFKETNLTNAPKHIQLPQAILRENRVPGEMCQVAPEVRKKIEELRSIPSPDGKGSVDIIDIMTNPEVPMSMRMKLQDHYVWPMVQDLLEKDEEEKQKEQDGKREGEKDSGEEGKSEDEGKSGVKEEKGKPSKGGDKGKSKKPDPNQIFEDAYDKADKKTPDAVPVKEIKKSFKKWQEAEGENSVDRADNEYAEKLGVKKSDLQKYRDIVESFEKIINPETGENIIQELRDLIERIIAKRLKPAQAPHYPVEEGEDLVDPAQLIADVKAGNLEPKVWETTEVKEKRGDRFGEVEITLVCDRSSSMTEGAKLREQQKAAVLMMEALKEFAERCDEEKVNLEKPLEVKSEIYSFQNNENDAKPLKKMSKELGEKERIEAARILSSAPGGRTTDYVTLKAISKNLDDETKKKILEGELKKIVMVFTDGKSHGEKEVQENLKTLRDSGVIVMGIGITKDAEATLKTYAPNARVVEKVEDLVPTSADLLKGHLANI